MMQDVKSVIKQCFTDIYTISRVDAKKHFRTDKKQSKQYDIARSLVVLADVAKNPDKHFAPEWTKDAWNQRTFDYMEKHAQRDVEKYGRKYVAGVVKASIVQQPYSIVFDKSRLAFQDKKFFWFCEAVQDFYYQDEYDAYVNLAFIQEYAKQIADWAKIAGQKNPVRRKLQEFVYGGYTRQY